MRIPLMNPSGWIGPTLNKPVYYTPVYYSENNGKLIMRWGLGWFYFKQLFKDRPNGNLHRTVWFSHLKVNLVRIPLMPLILLVNYINSGRTRFFRHFYDVC